MLNFKFFQKPKLGLPQLNHYNGYDMDECVLSILRYKQIHNEQILQTPTYFTSINVPIANDWIAITTWRTLDATTHLNERIEVDYSVYSMTHTPLHFTLRMDTQELLNLIQVERF